MNQGTLQILPISRPIPKTLLISMYSIVAVGLLMTTIVLLFSVELKKHSEDRKSNESADANATATTKRGQQEEKIKLRIMDDYEDESDEGIRPLRPFQDENHSWENDSTANLHSSIRSKNTATARPIYLPYVRLLSLEDVTAYECHYEPLVNNISWVEDNDEEYSGENLGESFEAKPEPAELADTDQHVTTIWHCSRDRNCRFNARILSSSLKRQPSRFAAELLRDFSRSVKGRFGDYSYEREESDEERRLRHKATYSLRLLPPDRPDRRASSAATSSFSNYTAECTFKTLQEYEFTWDSQWLEPKYTYSAWETCRRFLLGWTDEFIVSPLDHSRIGQVLLPEFLLPYTLMKHNKRKRRSSLASEKIKKNKKRVTSFVDPYENYSKQDAALNSEEKYEIRNSALEAVKIGKSSWVLHKIVQENGVNQSSFNIAMSKSESLLREAKSRSSKWVPRASSGSYKALLPSSLYVTRLFPAKILNKEEALVYFLAAPAANISVRFFYRVKVLYPPLDLFSYEPVDCLTCPDGLGEKKEKFEDGFQLSSVGSRPQCLYAEVRMTRESYVLNCRGPEIPWTAIVSTHDNLVVQQLQTKRREALVAALTSKRFPLRKEFQVELDRGLQVRVRLEFPPDWQQNDSCAERLKLLVAPADRHFKQLVSVEFELSLTTYLASVKRYAVLHGPELRSLRFPRLESLQLRDLARLAWRVAQQFRCIDADSGFAVLGSGYAGHLALSLLAEEADFSCAAALGPFAPWHLYVNPFTREPSKGTVGMLRRQLFKHRYLAPLARNLRDKDFALFTDSPKVEENRGYTENLLGLLRSQSIQFEHWIFQDSDCESKLKLIYEQVTEYFEGCFKRQVPTNF